jgi:hypothetical protein
MVRVWYPATEVGTVMFVLNVPVWSTVALPRFVVSQSRVTLPGVNHRPLSDKLLPLFGRMAVPKVVLLPKMFAVARLPTWLNPRRYSLNGTVVLYEYPVLLVTRKIIWSAVCKLSPEAIVPIKSGAVVL